MENISQNKYSKGWTSNFAYGVGLITSDGWLSKDIGRIGFGSKEPEMMENFKKSFALKNKIGKHARGGEREKRYFQINFRNVMLYNYLLSVGITPKKSKTIESVKIPDIFMPDFLRGLFDGDGTFYSSRDTRWPTSLVFKISFASASIVFIHWLKRRLNNLYGTNGYVHKGAGVFNLEYTKTDTRKLFRIMYYTADVLFLRRKCDKMKTVFRYDESLHRGGKVCRDSSMVEHSPEERAK